MTNQIYRMFLIPIALCAVALGISACLVDPSPTVLQEASPQVVEDEAGAEVTAPAGVEVETIETDDEAATVQPLDAAEVELEDEEIAEPLDLSTVLVQATYLINRDVFNLAGEEIAEVSDIVVDLGSGQIRYIVLSDEGLLGLGESEWAVPLSAFAWSPELEMSLTIDEALLDELPTVESDWPLVTDEAWDDPLIAYWGNVGVELAEPTDELPIRLQSVFGIVAGEIGGALGPIEDFLIDLGQGQVKYIAVYASPSFYTVDTMTLLPFRFLEIVEVTGEFSPAVYVDTELFLSAPSLERDLFLTVDFIDQPFVEEIDARWEELGDPTAE
jgi:sporulation protein YlmC with PRC-barrel domain